MCHTCRYAFVNYLQRPQVSCCYFLLVNLIWCQKFFHSKNKQTNINLKIMERKFEVMQLIHKFFSSAKVWIFFSLSCAHFCNKIYFGFIYSIFILSWMNKVVNKISTLSYFSNFTFRFWFKIKNNVWLNCLYKNIKMHFK